MFKFVMRCIISTVVVAFEINYLILFYCNYIFVLLKQSSSKHVHFVASVIPYTMPLHAAPRLSLQGYILEYLIVTLIGFVLNIFIHYEW